MLVSLLKVLLVIALQLTEYRALDWAKKSYGLQTLVTRKIAHVLSALVCVPLLFWMSRGEFAALLIFFLFFFAVAHRMALFSSIHLRNRVTYGEVWFPAGLLVVVLLAYDVHLAAVAAFLVLAISDTCAGLVGHAMGSNGKSALGSLAFFSSALIVLLGTFAVYTGALTFESAGKALVIASAATLAEAVSPYGSDNLSVPLVVAALCRALFF